jgi:hypothetical protein
MALAPRECVLCRSRYRVYAHSTMSDVVALFVFVGTLAWWLDGVATRW